MQLKDLGVLTEEKDTRDNSKLYVFRLNKKVDNFKKIQNVLKGVKCYYSGYKGGFISRNEIDLNLEVETVVVKDFKERKVVYFKQVCEYITKEELKKRLEPIYKEIISKNESFTYYQDLDTFVNHYYNEELSYIREAIILKSLGRKLTSRNLSYEFMYDVLYDVLSDKLDIIEGLEITNEAYSSTWGYDQTNVDIVYKLNKKCFGLDALLDISSNEVLLKRIKDDSFSDGCRYFTKESNPEERVKQDASYTGYYH